MDRLIYTAVSGLGDSMTRQRVIASNMANAQTIGFRAEILNSMPVTLKGPSLEARAMTSGTVRGADMRSGSITSTGGALDIAVEGTDMIAVQAADGSEAYTRRGDLSISPSGALLNGDGAPVLGSSGPITVPPGGSVSISADGTVMQASDVPGGQPQPIDRIKLASPTGSTVEKGLDGLFRVAGGGALPTNEDAKVQTGALEQSNVNPSEVLVKMLEAQRLFDIRTRVVSTAKDVDESGTQLMRISGAS